MREMDFNEVKAKSDRYLFQNYGRIPMSFTHGSGCYLYGSDGREYLDLVAGIAVNSLGYAHPDVTRAIQEQAARMTHVSNLYYVEQQAELAERIASITPDGLDRTLFCNSGAEANEGALKTAVRYTGRTRVLAALDGFHGRTSAAMGATGQESIQRSFEPLIAHSYDYFTFGDLESVKEMMTKDVAALIVEPIQGESGVHTASAEFFKGIRDLCTDNGTMMVVDEVQTGIGRTGEWYGIQNYGVVPDIISMAPEGHRLAEDKGGPRMRADHRCPDGLERDRIHGPEVLPRKRCSDQRRPWWDHPPDTSADHRRRSEGRVHEAPGRGSGLRNTAVPFPNLLHIFCLF